MIRNSIHTFDGPGSTGISKVPIFGIVHIEDFNGRPRFVQKIKTPSPNPGASLGSVQEFMDDVFAWQEVSLDKLGAAYNDKETYVIGDIVTIGTVIYVCNTDISTPEGFDVFKWTDINGNEIGGVLYDASVSYIIGDIVSWSDSMYLCVLYNDAVDPKDPSVEPLHWSLVSSGPEKGGLLYRSTETYNIGDVVSDPNDVGNLYVSVASNNIGNSLLLTASWMPSMNSIFHNAKSGGDENGDGTLVPSGIGGVYHCPWDSTSGDPVGVPVTPNGLGEYPDTALGEKVGAIWYISGLGVDTYGEPISYLMTTGDLSGRNVVDNDKFTWMSGDVGSETWLFSPFPRVSGERGGITWRSSVSYVIGDIVSYNKIIYVALLDSTGEVPDASPTFWETQKSDHYFKNLGEIGLTDNALTDSNALLSFTKILNAMPDNSFLRMDYDNTSHPKLGSVTMYGGGILEVQKTDGIMANTFINTSANGNGQAHAQIDQASGTFIGWDWNVKSDDFGELEKGGIAWDTNYAYVIGDQVSYDDETYVALLDNSAAHPIGVTDPNWKITSKGRGIKWIDTEVYAVGDQVSYSEEVYTCILPGTAGTLPTATANWKRTSGRGVVWALGISYLKGDIVTDINNTAYVTANAHTSLTGNVGDGAPEQPLQTNWTRIGYDVGGTVWKATETYAVGDQVSRVSGIAPTATTTTYTCITAHGAQAWVDSDWQDNNDGGTF